MGFIFRKRIKLLKGVHLNLGKTGTSLSVGGKGFSVTKGRGRTTVSVGAPGTGLSYRVTSTDKRRPLPPESGEGDGADDGAQRQAAAYEAGRGVAQLGLPRWLAGKALRVLGALMFISAAISSLASVGEGVFASDWPQIAVLALLAVSCWVGGARLLSR